MTLPVVDFFFFEVSAFTFSLVVGAAGALAIGDLYARRVRLPRDLFWSAAVVVTLVGIVGARLAYVAMHPDYFGANPDQVLNFDQGGLAWRGALLAGSFALVAFAFLRRVAGALLQIADAFAAGLPLALSIGWYGAHAQHLYYGAPNDGIFAQELPDGFGIYDLRFPVQLTLSLFFALVFVLLLWVMRRHPPPGRIAATFLIASALGNFALSFFRGDETLWWNGLRVDQWLDMVIGASGLILLFTRQATPAVRLRIKSLVVRHPSLTTNGD